MTAASTPRTEIVPGIVTHTEIAAKLRQHAEVARGAFASNTERALRADVVVLQPGKAARTSLPHQIVW